MKKYALLLFLCSFVKATEHNYNSCQLSDQVVNYCKFTDYKEKSGTIKISDIDPHVITACACFMNNDNVFVGLIKNDKADIEKNGSLRKIIHNNIGLIAGFINSQIGKSESLSICSFYTAESDIKRKNPENFIDHFNDYLWFSTPKFVGVRRVLRGRHVSLNSNPEKKHNLKLWLEDGLILGETSDKVLF